MKRLIKKIKQWHCSHKWKHVSTIPPIPLTHRQGFTAPIYSHRCIKCCKFTTVSLWGEIHGNPEPEVYYPEIT